jgi:hypothetical protein
MFGGIIRSAIAASIGIAMLLGSECALGGDVSVRGYHRKDGTYVRPHMRSAPDGRFENNWSTYGNVNPYTGKLGTKRYPSSSKSRGSYSDSLSARGAYSDSMYGGPAPDQYEPAPRARKTYTRPLTHSPTDLQLTDIERRQEIAATLSASGYRTQWIGRTSSELEAMAIARGLRP